MLSKQKMIPSDCVKWVPMTTVKKKAIIPSVVKRMCWDTHKGAEIGTAKCACCGIYDIRMDSFHCGHVIAEVNGGTLAIENLRPICPACNSSMGTENMEDFRKRCNFTSESGTQQNIITHNWEEIKQKEKEDKEKKLREEFELKDKIREELKKKKEEIKEKTRIEKIRKSYEIFKKERIVDMRKNVLNEIGNEQATVKDVYVAYKNWVCQNEGATLKKISKQDIQNLLDEDFGSLGNGVYKKVMVFFDDEGMEEFITERNLT